MWRVCPRAPTLGVAAARPRGLSASRPRRRRGVSDPRRGRGASPWKIHVTAAASPRRVSDPRRDRGASPRNIRRRDASPRTIPQTLDVAKFHWSTPERPAFCHIMALIAASASTSSSWKWAQPSTQFTRRYLRRRRSPSEYARLDRMCLHRSRGVAATRLHGISTSRPRRRRESSPRNIHVAAAASPRFIRGTSAPELAAPRAWPRRR